MDNLPKKLVSFFISYFVEKSSEEPESSNLVRTMLAKKKVQSIITKALYKLDPILNNAYVKLKKPNQKLAEEPLRKTRLLVLSDKIKQELENYGKMKENLTSLKSIIEDIDISISPLPISENKFQETPRELVKFLGDIAEKKQIPNHEIEGISDDTWTKHNEVEKMLKVELEKYYCHLNSVDSKFFTKLSGVKFKAGKKIEKLELELIQNREHFRLLVDRAAMSFEDKLSQEVELDRNEESALETNNEVQVKDYNSAVAKIKSLFTVRKILEKKKAQNEKLVNGLNTRIEILNDKVNQLVSMNSSLIENCSSLSWCLEYIFNKSDMPEDVRAKALKLLHKQKCLKLQGLFSIDEILEKYSIETVSKKFQVLREGIASVSSTLKDENLKIRLSRLLNESKIEELSKSELMKNIHPGIPPISAGNKLRGKSGSKSEILPVKDLPKKESALERMRKAMQNIDEEIKQHDKVIEELIVESNQSLTPVLNETTPKEKSRVRTLTSKTNMKPSVSPKSFKSNAKTEYSYIPDEVLRETRSTQIYVNYLDKFCQKDLKFYEIVVSLIETKKRKTEKNWEFSEKEVENFVVEACREKIKDKADKNIQTDKDPSFFEFSTPSTSIIRGIMNKYNNPKSDQMIKYKETLDPNVADNLIIKKLKKRRDGMLIFKTELENAEDEVQEITENPPKKPQPEKKSEKSLNRAKPEPSPIKASDNSSAKTKTSSSIMPANPNLSLSQVISNESSKKPEILKKKISFVQNVPNKSLSPQDSDYSSMKSSNFKLETQQKEPAYQQTVIEAASEFYKKEFALQVQLQGLKKMSFMDIQKIWEDVINRRILDGEIDQISVHLRGYLGTDKYEEEKAKIIKLIQSGEWGKQSLTPKPSRKTLENWRKIIRKITEKLSFNFKSQVSETDSPREVLFKIAKHLKFVKHRLPSRLKNSSLPKRADQILYSSEKWTYSSTSVSPNSSIKKIFKKNKYQKLKSKTPIREKYLYTDSKLPQLTFK